ncbi:MAG: hypothetical protein L0H78_16295 [Humibacillus sp.]|nr:hypothetical protein [Humibacillus sp.]
MALVVVSIVAGLTASGLKWPLWAAGILALFLYAVVWAASRLLPVREQPPEPADLRLVRIKRRD